MNKTIASLYPGVNKTELAVKLGVSRTSLYYVPKRPELDADLKCQIESVMTDHPSYGHKRIALALKLNKKRDPSSNEEVWSKTSQKESKGTT